jgi:hypothetical protein
MNSDSDSSLTETDPETPKIIPAPEIIVGNNITPVEPPQDTPTIKINDDSSDDPYPTRSTYWSCSRMSKTNHVTEVEVSGSKVPVLHPGSLTPKILHRFENACKSYFRNKKVEAADHVASIAGNMLDTVIPDWYWEGEARFNALTFKEFMVEMRSKWLDDDWENDIRLCILGSKQGSSSFWDWTVEMRGLNATICRTTCHLKEDALCNQLEVNMDIALMKECHDKKTKDIKDLEKWIARIKELDEKIHRDRLQAKVDAEEAARITMKRTASAAGILEPSHRYNANPVRNCDTPILSTNPFHNTKAGPKLSKLTSEKRAVLQANNGCFKCRCPNAGHVAKDCPGNPSWNKTKQNTSDGRNTHVGSQKPVAAIMEEENFKGYSSRSAPCAEVMATSSYPIAVILPPPNDLCVVLLSRVVWFRKG